MLNELEDKCEPDLLEYELEEEEEKLLLVLDEINSDWLDETSFPLLTSFDSESDKSSSKSASLTLIVFFGGSSGFTFISKFLFLYLCKVY